MIIRRPSRSPQAARLHRAVTCLMLGLWLGLQIVGVSSALHAWLHPDQATPGHHCIVTLVSQGQVHHATAGMPALVPELFEMVAAVNPTVTLVVADHWLLPERGPPALLS